VKSWLPAVFLAAALCAHAAGPGGSAICIGGTLPEFTAGLKGAVRTAEPDAFVFASGTSTIRIPYARIGIVEYGQEVGRRVLLGYMVSPMFLLLKKRAHYVTLGFTDASDRQQVLVLRVDKSFIRSMLATLEARTGRAVRYLDHEARKSRQG